MDEPKSRDSLSNEVFERDLHTGDVIHNHFYSHPRDTSNLPTESSSSPSSNIVPQYFSYKEIGAGNWIFIGVVSGLTSAFIPSFAPVTGLFSFLGFIILIKNRDIGVKQPGHPDTDRISTALNIIIFSLFCLPFGWLIGWDIFF